MPAEWDSATAACFVQEGYFEPEGYFEVAWCSETEAWSEPRAGLRRTDTQQ
jgi:hypothetical protein